MIIGTFVIINAWSDKSADLEMKREFGVLSVKEKRWWGLKNSEYLYRYDEEAKKWKFSGDGGEAWTSIPIPESVPLN